MFTLETPPTMKQCSVKLARGVTLACENPSVNTMVLYKAAAMRASFYGEDEAAPQIQVTPTRPADCKKRVHFGNNDSFCTYPAALPAMEDAESPTLWWDKVSLESRRSSDKRLVCKNSLRENPAFHESVIFLMKTYNANSHCRQKLMERVDTLRDADVRGLERCIVSVLKEMRVTSVKEILKFQRELQGESFTRPEIAATLLRRKSLKLSRAARQLAFRLAQADRQEAKEIHKGSEF
jgi:hypothetical protein